MENILTQKRASLMINHLRPLTFYLISLLAKFSQQVFIPIFHLWDQCQENMITQELNTSTYIYLRCPMISLRPY